MASTVHRWLALLLLCATASASAAYKEKPGGKDHPMVSRYQGSMLANYGVVNFDQVDIPLGKDKTEKLEGKVYNYYYLTPQDRSELEVFRNFQQALAASNFKILFSCDVPRACETMQLGRYASEWTSRSSSFVDGYSPITRMGQNGNYPPRYLVARLSRPQGDVTVVLTITPPSSTQKDSKVGAPYFLQVIETQPMQTGQVAINADALGKGMEADGKVALYGIYFDTGKAELKPESKPQLAEMAKLLGQNKTLKVFVVGHTDNVGALDANLALSQKRAEAVAAALAREYKVDAKRLLARGSASYAPVASNHAEAGRALNRRVELVEQ